MSNERLLLDSYLKTLKLPTMRTEYKALARKCSEANAAYEDFLQQLAELCSFHSLDSQFGPF